MDTYEEILTGDEALREAIVLFHIKSFSIPVYNAIKKTWDEKKEMSHHILRELKLEEVKTTVKIRQHTGKVSRNSKTIYRRVK